MTSGARIRRAKRRAHRRGEEPGARTVTTATGDVRPKPRPFLRALGKLGRAGAALATGGASEAAIAVADRANGKRPKLGRVALAFATGGASEAVRLGAKLLRKRGHKGDGPNPHPFFNGPPRPRPGERAPKRRDVARHLAGLHGPVLGDKRHQRFIHPRPGALHHARRDVFRARANLLHDKG